MANFDSYDLPISTASGDAAERYREGVSLMLAAWPGAGGALDRAIAADPEFALAHAARARLHAMRAEAAAARSRIAVAEEVVSRRGTDREKSHVGVLAHAISGRSGDALKGAYGHAAQWPRDTIILALPLGAFGLLAFSGMPDHDQARVDLCERHASSFSADDWWFLTYRGWALAENGDVARGRAMLERAFELRRKNANGVHALVHAMFEGGTGEDADALIAEWLPDYDRRGILHGHIAWHAALVALERGDAARALEIYTSAVQPSASLGMPINIVSDAASLLWRVGAYGHPVPARLWQDIAAYACQAYPTAGHAFIDPHLAIIEAETGGGTALDRRLVALDELVAAGSLAAGHVVPAIGRAARAFAAADYAACVRTLEPVAHEAVRIGGSGAQRELVADMLLLALMRSGDVRKARALLDRRLHRRASPRDARWRNQLDA